MLPGDLGKNAPVRPDPGATARGFTLLEIIVALAIAGLALVGMFRAGGDGMRAVDAAGHVDEAIERAQSHLAAFGRIAAIAPGETEGDDGGGYHWRVRARPVANWPVGAAPATATARLYEVEVSISWKTGGRRRSAVLTSLRLG
jgi:general secretion pathway protein I